MTMKIDSLYMKALKAVTKGYRTTSPGGRIRAEDRNLLKMYAKWMAEDPVFAAEVQRRKLPTPSPENLAKASYRSALKELVRGYRQGWGRRKVSPEHRQSLLAHAASIAGPSKVKGSRHPRYTFLPRKLSEELSAARRQKKKVAVALVDGNWFKVHSVAKSDFGDKPYFIGLGSGFDILRYVVLARSEDDAIETAEYTWPKVFFNDITSKIPANEDDSYSYIEALDKWGKREEDVRIFKKAREFHANAINVASNLYRLKDGRVIEAR